MRNLLQSKTLAWCAFIVVFFLVIASIVTMRSWTTQYWTLADEFCAFMMVFCQLIAVYMNKYAPDAGSKLSACAAIFGVLMIISFIVEYILMN
ncbi:MAG: hypothetical protein K2K64_01895 [Muribaculaceae bacterium]|nr:hypothetical protein [Muribaculaceae bacterium]